MNFLETLNEYKSCGLIFNQVHPTLPLTIWNYTPETQYGGHWDETTLACRGLVTDDKGNIIAKGFSKFFNMEEEKHEATDDFEVFEKLDGSLILAFWYAGQMIVASRGSFTSPYALEARNILYKKYRDFETNMLPEMTYCFELIGFEQIVVSYPETDLILTGMFGTDGVERSYKNSMSATYVKHVKKFHGLDWKSIKELNWQNSEGFVVKFSNGQRCKIKFEDYIKLHRQMTNLSTTGIWEALAAGEPVSTILNDVPDEFYGKVHAYETKLMEEFSEIKDISIRYFNYFKPLLFRRKLFAEKINKLLVHPYKSLVLGMIDGNNCDSHIWDYIKPKFEKI